MSNPSDTINPDGAVDLSYAKEKAVDFEAERAKAEQVAADEAAARAAADEQAQALRAEAAQQERLRSIMDRATSWDKGMQRAFKGIMPRATRHYYLRRGVEA